MPLRVQHELEPTVDAPVPTDAVAILASGTNSVVDTTPDALEILELLDGEIPSRMPSRKSRTCASSTTTS